MRFSTDIRTVRTIRALVLSLALLALASPARADEPSGAQSSSKAGTDRPIQNFGGWLVSFEDGRVGSSYLCGEYGMGARWSVVGCGSGAGFLYEPRRGQSDLAHFRLQRSTPIPGLPMAELSPGIGVVELQRGRDESGLKFAPGRGPNIREASGTEVSLELELSPETRFGLFRSLHFRGNVGAAWIPDAPAVTPAAEELSGFFYLSLNGTY